MKIKVTDWEIYNISKKTLLSRLYNDFSKLSKRTNKKNHENYGQKI